MNMQGRFAVTVVAGVGVLGGLSLIAQGTGGRAGGFTRPSISVRRTDPRAGRALMTSALGWRLAARVDAVGAPTFWDAAATADAGGLAFVEAVSTQRVSPAISKDFDPTLTPPEVDAVMGRLDELRLRTAAYRIDAPSSDEAALRRSFAFGKRLGASVVVVPAEPAMFAMLDALAADLDLHVAIESRSAERSAAALAARSERLGLAVTLGDLADASAHVPAALERLIGRVLAIEARASSGPRATGREPALADASAGLERRLVELSRRQLPSRLFDYPPPPGHDGAGSRQPVRPVLITIRSDGVPDPATDLRLASVAVDAVVRPAIRAYVDGLARVTSISTPERVPEDQRRRVAAAVPREPAAAPKASRKLLVLDLAYNGSFYHGSTPLGNLSLQLMSENTGAFTPVFSNDLENLSYPRIAQFDGVFLNQIQGNLFDDERAIAGLTRFVREGGGVAALHAASWASPNVPEFGDLLGATSGAHKYNGEMGAIRVDDPDSPLTRQFGARTFEFMDEFYHYVPTGPYSREKLHVLLSLDPNRRDLPANQYTTRPDNDYGLVWIRNYGRGRVFNCALGHRPEFYESAEMQRLVLAGVQFVLGDLDADATPSGRPPPE